MEETSTMCSVWQQSCRWRAFQQFLQTGELSAVVARGGGLPWAL